MNMYHATISHQTECSSPRGKASTFGLPNWGHVVCLIVIVSSCGCTALTSPIRGIPARRLPPQFLVTPRANLVQTDLNQLRQKPPSEYRLDAGDVLGIYIEGVLGDAEESPPIHFPDESSNLAPAVGYPMPVRDDGTLSLPLVEPLLVQGMTIAEVERAIREEYTINRQILQPDNERIIVSLIKERTTRVIVIREDGGERQAASMMQQMQFQAQLGPERRGAGHVVNLPAYQNDVMHALAETGGMPGLSAKNEIKIVKAKYVNESLSQQVEGYHGNFHQMNPCNCPPPPPDAPGVIRIPLRLPPGVTPDIRQEDVILEDGDIVYIESRDAEVFYTAGLLPGGQHMVPRDYDITVLAAMGIAGGGVDQAGRGLGSMFGGLSGAPPTDLYILRPLPCNQQITIRVDLTRAMNNPRDNILVGPGDTLILRYAPKEELVNFGVASFFTYGIRELFRN